MRIVLILSILFSLALSAQVSKIKIVKEDTTVYDFPDELAEYPGGHAAMLAEIRKNLMYPGGCMECTGTIYIKFVVNKKGEIANVTAINSINGCSGLKDEAIRALKTLSLSFKPAKLNGTPLNSYMQVPVKFKLTE
jgi:protein TonB